MTSILDDIKKLLGLDDEYTIFDQDIIMYINAVFSILTQMGVGPASGFSITGRTQIWNDYISDMSKLEMIKSYVGLKVSLMFDPPTSNLVLESKNKYISELEYRIYTQVDSQGGFTQ